MSNSEQVGESRRKRDHSIEWNAYLAQKPELAKLVKLADVEIQIEIMRWFTAYHCAQDTLQEAIYTRIEEVDNAHQIRRYDKLGLLSSEAFLDDVSQDISLADKFPDYDFALVYVDATGFKRINDKHGHAVGDKALEEIYNRLDNAIREYDSIVLRGDNRKNGDVYRNGGDEFVLLLRDVNSTGAQSFLDRLDRNISFTHNDKTIELGIRAGYSNYMHQDLEDSTIDTVNNILTRAEQMANAENAPGCSR